MLSKSNRGLLLIAVALAAWFGFFELRRDSTEARRRLAARALRVEAERVRSLQIESEGLRLAATREGERWTMTEPIRAPADAEAIGRLLLALERLPRGETVTPADRRRADARLADYGLDPPRARIVLGGEGPPLTLRIGRATPIGDGLYLQVEGSDELFTSHRGILALLPDGPEKWRDRALYRGESAVIRRIEVRRPEGLLRIERDERGGWIVASPHPVRANRAAVAELLAQLLAGRVGEFVAEGAIETAGYGLDEPAITVEFTAAGLDPAAPLLLGNPVANRPDWRYAAFRGGAAVFTVSADLIAPLRAPLDDYRDRRLTALDPAEIASIRVENGDLALRLARRAEGWMIEEPAVAPADPDLAEALVRSWSGAPIERFDDSGGTPGEFDPPFGRVLLSRKASADEAAADEILLVSRHPPADGRVRTRSVSGPIVFEIPARLIESLSPDPLLYRDRRLFNVPPEAIYRLSLARGGAAQSVRRDAGGAFVPEHGGAADDAALRARLTRILSARARRYVAERPADLSPYGLDAPAAEFTMDLTGEAGIRKTVLIGRREGAFTYAMLRGRDLVFLADDATLEDWIADLTAGGTGAEDAAARPEAP